MFDPEINKEKAMTPFMKQTLGLLAAVLVGALILVAAVRAETVTYLRSPASSFSCSPVAFDANDNVHGYCATESQRSNGGRSITYTFTVYATTWAIDGVVEGNVHCGTLLETGPTKLWTYAVGYGPANCALPTGNVGPFALINGRWYTIKAYSTDGAYEAGSGNEGPVLVAF